MNRIAFKMQLHSGCAAEYKKRHDELWPELREQLKSAGVHDYSVFLDAETNTLFATLKVVDVKSLEALSAADVMKKWWLHMADIMESNPDHSPVLTNLTELFYLP
jgi:L-rhamnose mutarotase